MRRYASGGDCPDEVHAGADRAGLPQVARYAGLRRCLGVRPLRIGVGQLIDAVSIRERSAEADDRAVPGHWEGDLFCGANNTHLAMLVERRSRFAMLTKAPSKDSATVIGALSRHVRTRPQALRRSLT